MPRILNVLILFLLSSVAQADEVDALLDKMMHAMKMNNYEGTLVVRQKDKLQAMHVKHGMDENGMWESLESLSGESRQVIRQNNKVTTIFPDRKLITVSRSQTASPLHPQLPENRITLKKLYQLKLIGKGRVAKKNAQILAVIPKDRFRYGYKYWLDKETGLLLKCDLLDEQGKVIEQLMFSELNVLSDSPQSHSLIDKASDYQLVDLDKRKAEKKHENQNKSAQWKVQQLPSGFVLTRAVVKISSHGKGMVQHLTYSDGMSSVSIFVEKDRPEKMALKGVSRMGAVNAFGLPVNNYHVTAIGEVPMATVRMIAESVYYTGQ
jgi:sigma-E factor negative regulatory protein RseB